MWEIKWNLKVSHRSGCIRLRSGYLVIIQRQWLCCPERWWREDTLLNLWHQYEPYRYDKQIPTKHHLVIFPEQRVHEINPLLCKRSWFRLELDEHPSHSESRSKRFELEEGKINDGFRTITNDRDQLAHSNPYLINRWNQQNEVSILVLNDIVRWSILFPFTFALSLSLSSFATLFFDQIISVNWCFHIFCLFLHCLFTLWLLYNKLLFTLSICCTHSAFLTGSVLLRTAV